MKARVEMVLVILAVTMGINYSATKGSFTKEESDTTTYGYTGEQFHNGTSDATTSRYTGIKTSAGEQFENGKSYATTSGYTGNKTSTREQVENGESDATTFSQTSEIMSKTTNKSNITNDNNSSVTIATASRVTRETNVNVNDTTTDKVGRNFTMGNGGHDNNYFTTVLPTSEKGTTTLESNPNTESDTPTEEDVLLDCIYNNDGVYIDLITSEYMLNETVVFCCQLQIKNYDVHSLMTKEMTKVYEIIEFWISICLVFIGLVGNGVSFVILYREKTSTSMFLLKALSSCDALYCLWYLMFAPYSIAYEITPWIKNRESNIVNWIPFHFLKLGLVNYVLQTISIWLVVLLTIDRYIAICYPFRAKVLCTLNKVRIEVGVLIILSICFAIPKGFQNASEMSVNACLRTPYVETVLTKFGESFGCAVVYNIILDGFLRYIIPVIMVLVMNILLIRVLTKAAANRVQMSSISETSQQDNGITKMLVTVATVFLILILPQVGAKILKSLVYLSMKNKISLSVNVSPTAVESVVLASNLALRLNSSINFILYIIVSQRFRKGFAQLFRCSRVLKSDTTSSGSRTSSTGASKSEL
ncbi:unnamed protein product [Owenia fusiformis]|uniref:Uncharacterized protein n=1 Tax=Owenia fusiformis TaxID=6347 RepID=A0A8J1XFP8_OWEFU|nr:unnamed protein product [Owenia fusiformis]